MTAADNLATLEALRRAVELKREKAKDALQGFAESASGLAKELAPVRKVYSTSKAKKKLRAGNHAVSPEEYEMMVKMASRTSWTDKWGRQQQGYAAPTNVKIRTRHRLPKQGVASRNRPDSKYRTIGTVRYTTRVVQRDNKRYRTKPTMSSLTRTKGIKFAAAFDKKSPVPKIQQIGKLGPSVQKHMNAKQLYDIRHGRGVEILMNKAGTKGKIVLGGHLKRSIEAAPDSAQGSRTTRWMVIAGASYAKYVEFGTRYMDAQPFMAPTLIMARRRMRQDIASRMRG